jgi:hypothetical protein
MNVALEIPEAIDFQLVYRMERDAPYDAACPSDMEFAFIDSSRDAAPFLRRLRPIMGALETIKALPKLATGIRNLYLVLHGSQIVSLGWGTVGLCRHYKVERDAVVIGPIWSDPAERGKGLATLALQLAINEYLRRGKRLFYIDTSKANHSAQRVFAKSDFGTPVALYFR